MGKKIETFDDLKNKVNKISQAINILVKTLNEKGDIEIRHFYNLLSIIDEDCDEEVSEFEDKISPKYTPIKYQSIVEFCNERHFNITILELTKCAEFINNLCKDMSIKSKNIEDKNFGILKSYPTKTIEYTIKENLRNLK